MKQHGRSRHTLEWEHSDDHSILASQSMSQPAPKILSLSDAKLLIGLCHRGKLYEIEKWISDGKSLHLPPECKTTPLQVALDCGFHSLVELLARNECLRQITS